MKKYFENIKFFRYGIIIIVSYIIMLFVCNFISGGVNFSFDKSYKIFVFISLFILHGLLYKNKMFYLLNIMFLGCMYISIIYIKVSAENKIQINEIYMYFIFSFAALNLLILIISFINKGQIIISILLLSCVYSPILIFWSYYCITHTMFNGAALLAILQTNIAESIAYIRDFSGVFNYILICLFLIIMIAIAINLKNLYIKKGLSIFLLVICVIDIFLIYKTRDNILLNVFKQALVSVEEYENFKDKTKQRQENIKSMLSINENNNDGVYVVIIGESQNKKHMSAYGYDEKTTPWLDKMKIDSNFMLFEKAYSCHTHTVPNLTYALTAKNQYNELKMEKSPSIIEVANLAGYDTVWLSNQVQYGAWDTPITIIANEANQQKWINANLGETTKTNFYDIKLVDSFNEINLSKKMLIVVHLMGNHGSYEDRYPEEFNKFSGKTGTYDNSMLYNDYVVSNIYRKVKTIPNFKALIYFSDHSEAIDENLGHDSSSFRFSMTYIPMYMYFSDTYIKDNPEIVKKIQESKNKYITNDLIFNTVLGVMNIKLNDIYEPQNDITNIEYDSELNRFKTLYGEKFIYEDE